MKWTARKTAISIPLVLSLVLFSFGLVSAVNPPIRYYGYVTVNSMTASDDTNVSVFTGSTLLDYSVVPDTASTGSGYYSLDINSSYNGNALTFKVNGVTTDSPAAGDVTAGTTGQSINQNLTATLCGAANISAASSYKEIIKRSSANYTLNITNSGNISNTFNVTVNTTNTSLWNYTLSSASSTLAAGASTTIYYSVIPTSNVTAGNYTLAFNLTYNDTCIPSVVSSLLRLKLNVMNNKTTSTNVNFTANQSVTINRTNGSSIEMDIITSGNVSDSHINITEENDDPTNASMNGVEIGKYVNATPESNLENNISYVMLRIYYTDDEFAYLGITNESALSIYWYNETSNEWIELYAGLNDSNGNEWVIAVGVNTTDNFVWANLTHLSVYGLGGRIPNGEICTSAGQCESGRCGYDYDGVGAWCVASGYCAHDSTVTYATAVTACSGTTKMTCASTGNWTSTSCSNGCSAGACTSSSSSTTGGGGTATTGGGATTREIAVSADKTSVILTEGGTATFTITVENKGTSKETSVALTATGYGDMKVTIIPVDGQDIDAGNSLVVYTVSIQADDGTGAREYTLILTATSDEKTTASASVRVNVEETTQEVTKGTAQTAINTAESEINDIETQITAYEGDGWSADKAKIVLSEAKELLSKAKQAIASGDYAYSKGLADQARTKAISSLALMTGQEKPTEGTNTVLFVIIAVVIVMISMVLLKTKNKFF